MRRVDPISKLSYYVHVGDLGGKAKHSKDGKNEERGAGDSDGKRAAKSTRVGSGEVVELSEPGWYSFFDCDRYRLFYAHLGRSGWEHTTWKRPHETNIVKNGS